MKEIMRKIFFLLSLFILIAAAKDIPDATAMLLQRDANAWTDESFSGNAWEHKDKGSNLRFKIDDDFYKNLETGSKLDALHEKYANERFQNDDYYHRKYRKQPLKNQTLKRALLLNELPEMKSRETYLGKLLNNYRKEDAYHDESISENLLRAARFEEETLRRNNFNVSLSDSEKQLQELSMNVYDLNPYQKPDRAKDILADDVVLNHWARKKFKNGGYEGFESSAMPIFQFLKQTL